MRPISASVGPLGTVSATNIRTATTGTQGALVLNGSLVTGGVAVLPSSQQIASPPSAWTTRRGTCRALRLLRRRLRSRSSIWPGSRRARRQRARWGA